MFLDSSLIEFPLALITLINWFSFLEFSRRLKRNRNRADEGLPATQSRGNAHEDIHNRHHGQPHNTVTGNLEFKPLFP